MICFTVGFGGSGGPSIAAVPVFDDPPLLGLSVVNMRRSSSGGGGGFLLEDFDAPDDFDVDAEAFDDEALDVAADVGVLVPLSLPFFTIMKRNSWRLQVAGCLRASTGYLKTPSP